MNIILLGPQGSGKGTQGRFLVDKFDLYYFESGAYLRRIAENNLSLKKYLDSGVLVPDLEITSYVQAFLDKENLYDDIVFDGFPRTLSQYNFWKNWLDDRKFKLDLVIVLEISEEESIRRLSARRQDPKTGEIYNLITDVPPAGVDINSLVQRDDDKPEGVQTRLKLYRERTEPLIAQLKKDTKVVEVNGERSEDEMQKDLQTLVEELKAKKSNYAE